MLPSIIREIRNVDIVLAISGNGDLFLNVLTGSANFQLLEKDVDKKFLFSYLFEVQKTFLDMFHISKIGLHLVVLYGNLSVSWYI